VRGAHHNRLTVAAVTGVVAVVVVAVGAAYMASSSAGPAPAPAAATGVVTDRGSPVASVGCNRLQGPAVADQLQGIVVDGTPRWYLLTTPSPGTSGPTPNGGTVAGAVPRPLVLDFHGLAEGALLHSFTSRFGDLGQQDGFVVVFPGGTGAPVRWDTTDRSPSNPDLAYVAALLDQVESTQCIDTSRVYAGGFSDGAVMASLLACTMSDRFAAAGAVSGLELPAPCAPARPVPVIAFHGTADPILYFGGGVDSAMLTQLLGPDQPVRSPPTDQPADLDGPGVPATVRAWAVKDGCDPRPIDATVGTQVILRRYTCPPGAAVEFYIIVGGGHSWPGGEVSQADSQVGATTFQVDATAQMWDFFRQFHL
jgi:polyhydroxybutyrate depolymerase